MSDIAIKVENLSKRYRIGLKETQAETLAGALTGWLKSPFQNYRSLRRLSHFSENGHDSDDVLWALKDVSFEVKHGEVVGIIGRNGAGKSTLLKILSRITEPTNGRAIINGRVATLLEVGTGFHPDLTGRENVYLNGTVLGMSKREIDREFDEIIDFSGVEKFIDTPVKHYSSGMKVRLAFSVAAHLDPEILLIDEVLAVGDAEFQQKCLRKMDTVASTGRTVFFVSHNMTAVSVLCTKGFLLSAGRLIAGGPVESILQAYHQELNREQFAFETEKTANNKDIAVHSVILRNQHGTECAEIRCGDDIYVEIGIFVRPGLRIPRPWIGINIFSLYGTLITHIGNC
jgi:lipopolysaccharide transport system ATP-binding protein